MSAAETDTVTSVRPATFAGFDPYKLTGVRVTGRELGHGSYATVLELEYIGLKCAGKKIHELLLRQGDSSYTVQGFEEECRLLSQVRHPNIVQFLGVYFQQGVQAPILVMEFLPTNLTSCIEQYNILPKEISYSILHDVALGLCYLHSQTPPIIHRDLSSNNVLLTPNMTAKISDLGVARIFNNLTPLQVSRMTPTPGTLAFMPPEVMVGNPKYDTSVDEFSYGIIMIHVFSGQWPEPQVGPVCTEPDGTMIPLSEAERREVFLAKIGDDHPLMDLIRKCINNHPQRRAHASEIMERLAEMVKRFPASFATSLEIMTQSKSLKHASMTLTFSDTLSPRDLVDWLSQELFAKGLSLDLKVKDILIEEEINGAAFKKLSNEDLKEMGFKCGPRKNTMTIIEALKGKGNERMELEDPEERMKHDDKDELDAVSVPGVVNSANCVAPTHSSGATNYVAPPTAPTPHHAVHGQVPQSSNQQPPTMTNYPGYFPQASRPLPPTRLSPPRDVPVPYPALPLPPSQQRPLFPNSSPWTGACRASSPQPTYQYPPYLPPPYYQRAQLLQYVAPHQGGNFHYNFSQGYTVYNQSAVRISDQAPPPKKCKHAPSAQPPMGQIPLSTDIMQQLGHWWKKLAGSYLAEESKSDAWPPLRIVNFVQLALVQQEKHARHLNLHTIMKDIDEVYAHKINVIYDDLFQKLDHSSLILIEGRPGSGKTTLLVRISCDWAKGKIIRSKLIIFVRLQYLDKIKEIYLSDLLHIACRALSPEDISGLSSYIEGRLGEDVVFVLDGFNEYGVGADEDNFICNIISGKVFSRSTVILSSRPAATQGFRQIATQWIEVVGFMKEQVMQYIHTYFEHNKEKGVQLEQHLSEHTNVLNLCYLPIYCAMLVHLYEQESFLPETETKFYRYFTLSSIFRTISKSTKHMDKLTSFDQLRPKEKSIFDRICHLAFKAIVESQQVFKKSEILDICGDVGSMNDQNNSGLLVIDRCLSTVGYDDTYSFLHLTLQEYLSALYIAGCDDTEQISVVTPHANKSHLYVVWRFLFGILNYSKESTVNLLKLILNATDDDLLLHIQCAYESQNSAMCTEVLRFHKNNLEFKRWNPFDLACITYVLKAAEYTTIKLNFKSCDFRVDDAVALLKGVGDHQLSLTVRRGEAVQSVLDALSLVTVPGLIELDLFGSDGERVSVKNNLKLSANLQKLALGNIDISNLGLEEGFKHLPILEELELEGCNLDVSKAQMLGESLKLTSKLNTIDLSDNPLCDGGLLALSEGIKCCEELQELNLNRCNLGVPGARVLGEILQYTSKLHTLDLQGNPFGDDGLQDISKGIKNCEDFKELCLWNNHLTDNSIPCLTELIKSARNLEELDLRGNQFTPEGEEQIKEVVRESNSVGGMTELELGILL